MKIQSTLLIGTLILAASVQSAQSPNWDTLNAAARQEALVPLRPGIPGTRPFWNANARAYIHPPAFDIKEIPGTNSYTCILGGDSGLTNTWTALKPWHPIPSAIWDKLPSDYYTLTVAGARRRFWRAAVFKGPYNPAKQDYRTTAARVYAAVFRLPYVQSWKEGANPPAGYYLYSYPSKIISSMIEALVRHASLNETNRAPALAKARIMADWLIAHSQPADAPLAHFSPTYWGGRNPVSRRLAGQNMLLYPAHAAHAWLDLTEATGDPRYLEAAVKTAKTYMRLQGEDGTWPLKVREKDGKVLCPNRLIPDRSILGLFERLSKRDADPAYTNAAARAFAFVLNGPCVTWNWDSQFEDVDPKPPYVGLQKGFAVDTAVRLFKDKSQLPLARELISWSEDQFTIWGSPLHHWGWKEWSLPTVLEQYEFYTPVDASMGDMIRGFAAAYVATREPLYLAKAQALADNITRFQRPDGTIPTEFPRGKWTDWINCTVYVARCLEYLADCIEATASEPRP